jgi:hypothetical protein
MGANDLGIRLAAMQHAEGTMVTVDVRPAWTEALAWRVSTLTAPRMTFPPSPPREFYIQGITTDGKSFRPSDWAERLAGAMSSFRPVGAHAGIGSFIGYSPYCVPRLVDGIKCVRVNEALKAIEPMAWDFVMHFARDNDLKVVAVGDHEHPAA